MAQHRQADLPGSFLSNLSQSEIRAHSESENTERIETERHDFTQSTTTVGQRTSQLEFGYTYFLQDEESEDTHTPVRNCCFGMD